MMNVHILFSSFFVLSSNSFIPIARSYPSSIKKANTFYDKIRIPRYNVSLALVSSSSAQDWNQVFNGMANSLRNRTTVNSQDDLPIPAQVAPPPPTQTVTRGYAGKSSSSDCPYFGSMPVGSCGMMAFGSDGRSMDFGVGWGLGCPSGSYCYRNTCCTNPL